jgi:1-deoxy-D-xylulose-5-phosphate synthase
MVVQVSLPTQFNEGGQKPVGALSDALSKLQLSQPMQQIRAAAKDLVVKATPENLHPMTGKVDDIARGVLGQDSNIFSELGFQYVGPVDGHNVENLVDILTSMPCPCYWLYLVIAGGLLDHRELRESSCKTVDMRSGLMQLRRCSVSVG